MNQPDARRSTDHPEPITLEGYGSENPSLDDAFRIIDEAKPPKARSGRQLVACAAAEIAPGEKRIIFDTESNVSIGIFNVAGKFYALKNVCPHLGAPLCMGSIHATHRPGALFEFDADLDGRILRCPWHGWEFDIVTGKALYDAKSRVASYPCRIDNRGDIRVDI